MSCSDSSSEARTRSARTCIVSLRDVKRQAGCCASYEFEDVASNIDDVDLFTLRPGKAYSPREWLVKRLIWRRGLCQLARRLNPGLQPISLEKDYDLFAFICMNPSDLLYLRAVKGWKERCKTRVCFMAELYAGWLGQYAFHLNLLSEFDHIFLCFSGSVRAVQQHVGRPCHHVRFGADLLRFSPFPNPPARCVDVYSMGRRSETVHQTLLKMAGRKELFYIYDTIPSLSIQPQDYRQHRDLLANFGKRSRFFVTYPAKVDCADETRGQSEVGARFYEGAATGAILIGQAPTIPAFAKEFDWPDAVVNIGSSEEQLVAVLEGFKADPEREQALSRRNAVEALRRFDWSCRWKEILRFAGLEPTSRLFEREKRLNQLVAMAECAALQN